MVIMTVINSILLILMLAVLELNKNTVPGFVLVILLSAGYFFLRAKVLPDRSWFLKLLSWIAWIAVFAGIVFLTWPPVKSVPAVEYENPVYTEPVSVSGGDVCGVISEDGKTEIYAGIPYAKPPVGELRWAEPQDPEPWQGVLNCDTFAPMSMQPTNLPIYDSLVRIIGFHDYTISLDDNWIAPVSEDSLYLNIWKPAGDVSGLPVIVYIHGGSLQTGQPWYGDYAGRGLAEKGAVVVNMGYRLGVFGFYADSELANETLNHTTGNYGLLDQIKALKWVKENIAAFGGDPKNVTVAGESAGAACVSALCTSSRASGLFRRAILESSTVASVEPPHSFRTYEEAIESGNELKERYGCTTVEELRNIPAEELVGEASTQHHITIDGYVLNRMPYRSYMQHENNEQQILHGYNSRESASFLIMNNAKMSDYEQRVRGYFKEYADEVLKLYPASTDEEAAEYWAEIWGAVYFDYPHYCLNRIAVMYKIPVYEYYFSKDNGRLGPWHSGEMIYCYGNIPEDSKLFSERDRELSDQMTDYWINFARTGDPNGEGLPVWEQNLTSSDLMEFGETTGMITEREHDLFRVLDKMQGAVKIMSN